MHKLTSLLAFALLAFALDASAAPVAPGATRRYSFTVDMSAGNYASFYSEANMCTVAEMRLPADAPAFPDEVFAVIRIRDNTTQTCRRHASPKQAALCGTSPAGGPYGSLSGPMIIVISELSLASFDALVANGMEVDIYY